jgi:hypothetical protein
MNLLQLKNSLQKLGSDDNDSHVVLITMDKGKRKYTFLAATGLITNRKAIFLADKDAALDMIDKKEPTVDDWKKDLEE